MKGTHFLLTNDDGIDAPGLASLERCVRRIPDARISVVAPMREHSMCGHRLTTHSPLRVERRGDDRWAVDGTPADCVRLALFALGLKPGWVLSGVNAGGNLGQDIHVSGTCAAAREAAYHQVPSAAFSHYLIRDLAVDWERTADWTHEALHHLACAPLGDGEFWCVNFPHLPPGSLALPGMRSCHPARSPLPVRFRPMDDGSHHYDARYADRPRDPGSDVDVCFGGETSVVRLKV
ncbi:MAG: 5'/3'-nucleotidase SurE [Prosthecobacter sp.]|nr:5'/3'-nucleotidase SurE [Prosthecobacter sp.]